MSFRSNSDVVFKESLNQILFFYGVGYGSNKSCIPQGFEDLPMDNVGEKIVVPQPVLGVHLLVVDGQRAVQYTPLLNRGAFIALVGLLWMQR